LLFFPIPFEMLETYEEKPQMLVEIDHMPAVCHSMDCGFTHIAAVGEITSFTVAGGKLTVTGTNLPDNTSKIQSISIAQSTCTPEATDEEGTLSGTEIVCALDREQVCGNWMPKVTTFLGDVPVAESVSAQTITCAVSSMTPDTSTSPLNLLGDDTIVFTGTGFPHEMEDSTFDLVFSSHESAKCTVIATSTTALTCKTNRFNTNFDVDKTFTFSTFTINDVPVTNSLSMKSKPDV
jgi:hypothetical protein